MVAKRNPKLDWKEIQKEIIKSEIPLISDKTLLSVYENQIKLIDELIVLTELVVV